jgi:CO dehydrogenase nickel-insertion accessory protein CooC1
MKKNNKKKKKKKKKKKQKKMKKKKKKIITNAFNLDHWPSSREGQRIRVLVVGYVSTRRDPCSAPASQLFLFL